MNYLHLFAKCAESVNRYGENSGIILTIPRRANGNWINLAGSRGGPRGMILSWSENGTTATFNCSKVLKWLISWMLPYKCFICQQETAVIPWIVNVADRDTTALFTCKACPSLHDHLKDEYGATITSASHAINKQTEHLYMEPT